MASVFYAFLLALLIAQAFSRYHGGGYRGYKPLEGIAVMLGSIRVPYVEEDYPISGTVTFIQKERVTVIEVDIEGLPQGRGYQAHGMHIHEFGIMKPSFNVTERCNSAGEHYNPFNEIHGGLNTKIRHRGDLDNVVSNNEGVIRMTLETPTIKLTGPYSVLGRTIVLHQNRDDLGRGKNATSKINGNSGNRIACGVIGLKTVSKKY